MKMKQKHNCSIGIFHSFNTANTITFNDLVNTVHISQKCTQLAYIAARVPEVSIPTIESYLNSDNFEPFYYCPICGKKINYKKLVKTYYKKNK